MSPDAAFANDDHRMTPGELHASLALAGIFALRMLGLFLVLPVFAIEASRYPGGDDAAMVGLAFGSYGLTQAMLQIPFGWASDRWGRKPVIVAGLLLFAGGSLVAVVADTLTGLLAGRAIQGAGAISAAVTALLADQTRDAVRTKAMALVGGSIGLMFALSLVLAPLLVTWAGLRGLFTVTAVLAGLGIAVVCWGVPDTTARPDRASPSPPRSGFATVLRHRALWQLNVGVFLLHLVQLAMWVAVPALLVRAGLPKQHHWWVYLPAVLASFGVMGGVLFPLERRGRLALALRGAIGLVLLVQVGLLMAAMATASTPAAPAGDHRALAVLAVGLFVFFCGFNALEASQPSLVSRLAPADARGAALGVYNTLQSLGLFAGGALGGMLVKNFGAPSLFGATAVLCAIWLALAWRMPAALAEPCR